MNTTKKRKPSSSISSSSSSSSSETSKTISAKKQNKKDTEIISKKRNYRERSESLSKDKKRNNPKRKYSSSSERDKKKRRSKEKKQESIDVARSNQKEVQLKREIKINETLKKPQMVLDRKEIIQKKTEKKEINTQKASELVYVKTPIIASITDNKKEEVKELPYQLGVNILKQDAVALNSRAGGVYIPPFKLAMMYEEIRQKNDKTSLEYQKMMFEMLRKSINGIINKVNISNIQNVIFELFNENLVRGKGLLARAIIKAQMSSPNFTHVYSALIAVINTKVYTF